VRAIIPVAVNPVRPSPPLQRHATYCCNNSGTIGAHGGETPPYLQLHLVRASVNGSLEPVRGRRPDDQPLRHYPRGRSCSGTGHAMTPRLDRDSPGRQLHDTAHPAFTRRRIVRHTCKSLSPWPIKGGAIPQPQGTRDNRTTHVRIPPSPRYWHLPQSIPLGLRGQASSLSTLVAPLYEHHSATQYSASSTPLLDVRPQPEPG
jgi:hypothetical protein